MRSTAHSDDDGRPGLIARALPGFFSWRMLRRILLFLAGAVTLIAALWTEENLRGKHDWEVYKRQQEAKGERFDFASLAPGPVPDDQNFFKAPIWSAAFSQPMSPEPKKRGPLQGPPTHPDPLRSFAHTGLVMDQMGDWMAGTLTRFGQSSASQWQEFFRQSGVTNSAGAKGESIPGRVLRALSGCDPALAALRQASQRPDSRLPVDYNDLSAVMAGTLPSVMDLRACALVLNLRAVAELAENQTTQALSDVKLMFRLTDSVRSDPRLISHMIRAALLRVTLQPIYEGLARHRWTTGQLAVLDEQLAKEDFLTDYGFVMRGERAFSITAFGSLPIYRFYPFQYQCQLATARMYERWILPALDLTNRVLSPTTVHRLQAEEAVAWKHTTPYNIFAKMLFGATSRVQTQFARAQVSVDLARVACALERYRLARGQYPDELGRLAPEFLKTVPHDITNGTPLRYRRTPDGRFVLYSEGWDGTDDGGVRGFTAHGRLDPDKGDWVWEYPAS